jgi:hypothetical protein
LLRLIPLPLLHQLLDLRQLRLRGERHLIITYSLDVAEQRGPQPVERVAGLGVVDHRTEPAKSQHRGGGPAHHC